MCEENNTALITLEFFQAFEDREFFTKPCFYRQQNHQWNNVAFAKMFWVWVYFFVFLQK